MRLTVRVKPKSKQPSVRAGEAGVLIVAVQAAPTHGQANAAVIKAIAEHLNVSPSRVRIVRGQAGRTKIVDIVEASSRQR